MNTTTTTAADAVTNDSVRGSSQVEAAAGTDSMRG